MRYRLSITQRSPKFYGWMYLILIPFYALIYHFYPGIFENEKSFFECLYFSIVTITTLGYGDISPVGLVGQIVTSFQALSGVVLIGLFLNAVGNARSDAVRAEQEEKEKRLLINDQRARLNGHYRFIQPLIEKYKLSVTDIIRRDDKPLQPYDPNFTLNEMKDIYNPTLLTNAARLSPAIVGYFEIMHQLQKETTDLIKNVDLRHFPKIENLCLEIANRLERLDRSKEILSAFNIKVGDIPMTKHVSDMLKNYSGDYTLHELPNIQTGYILLYYQIKSLMEFLPQLQAMIDEEIGK